MNIKNKQFSPMLNLTEIFDQDRSLKCYQHIITKRFEKFREKLNELNNLKEGLHSFTTSYKHFGQNLLDDGSVQCKEWCPGVVQLSIFGEFNNFKRVEYKYKHIGDDFWQVLIPPKEPNIPAMDHDSLLKLAIVTKGTNFQQEKISPWCRYAVADDLHVLRQKFWNPPEPYKFKHDRPKLKKGLKIYEAHIGISSPEFKIASYKNFTNNILPKIKYLGYNTIQLMAIMEYAYYASFGYQVTNFFAASSRYGTPDELKELIDAAHGMDMRVVLDCVHSHASANTADGLNQFDGTDSCFFKKGDDGRHKMWGGRLFDYSNNNVLRFLLSNLRWWVEEYMVDGFRFDGVSSMLYHHHAIGSEFYHYDHYYSGAVDNDAVVYIMMANYLLHEYYPFIITIAEEWTGMPALTFQVEKGGFGFDYRLQMGVPDEWIKRIKSMRHDYDLDVSEIVCSITNRRSVEKHVAYVECHDQALVGNQTLAFLLMGTSMYYNMAVESTDYRVRRGVALHKVIRLITHALGGQAYLNFTGNEFGHPEWLDFPRAGNLESYMYARRQWHLVEDQSLKFRFLYEFDAAMNNLEEKYHWLEAPPAHVSRNHCTDMTIFFDRAGCVFVFNFHPHNSYSQYKIGLPNPGTYKLKLNSDDKKFGGDGIINGKVKFASIEEAWDGRPFHAFIDIPPRSGLIFCKSQ